MNRPFALLLLLVLAGLVPAHDAPAAEVYRCVTANGVVRYSDRPCRDGEVDKLDIESKPTDPAAVRERNAERSKEVEALERADAAQRKADAEAAKQATEQQAACTAARERLQRLLASRRVTTGEGADRRFLESEEIVQRRKEAQDKVNEVCSG